MKIWASRSLLYIFLITLVSCSDWFRVNTYNPGVCLKQKDKRYVLSEESEVYKIEKIRFGYYISVYKDRSWIHLGRKPLSYFDETKTFSFTKIDCPDAPKRGGGTLNKHVNDIAL